MTETTNHPPESKADTPPEPEMRKRSLPSLVWLIPLITALVGGWLIYKTLSDKGPQITITFETAEGIEAKKTKIKYKEIEIGVVDAIRFNSDFSHVIVTARMEKASELFLRRGTRFWVVKPRLTFREISGLGTLISGAYIEIEPGPGVFQTRFTGLDTPPVVRADVAGLRIVLLTGKLGSIDTGSPVYYQGILAGEVLGWELGNDRKSIFVHAFIKRPYDALVQSNTRFWNVSGMDVSVGSEGVRVRTESVQSLLYGGIAFDTPDTLGDVKKDVDGLVFTLYDDPESIQAQAYTKKITFILFFDGSVRGLHVGASVEFKGIKIGSVVDVRLEFDSRDTSFRIPVLIEIEPERVIERGKGEGSLPLETLTQLVDRGLRAQLRAGNLITGQLFVDLDMYPDTPVRLINDGGDFPELPTVAAGLEQMTASVQTILAKLENVDVGKIAAELSEALQGTSRLAQGASELINTPQLQGAVRDLTESLDTFKRILRKLDQRVDPVTLNLENAIGTGRQVLEKTLNTMGLVEELLRPDSPLQYRFLELSEELAETARSIRTLVDLLERSPNSIIFGKSPPGEK